MDFLIGVLASIIAFILIKVTVQYIWPFIQDRWSYKGIRVNGTWKIQESRNNKTVEVGRIEFTQMGNRITGHSIRNKTREGKKNDRRFVYSGYIHKNQITLTFEDSRGKGFDTGTYVFIVENCGKKMIGMATFHGKKENRIVSEQRVLTKLVS
jgi:hypothetical protein